MKSDYYKVLGLTRTATQAEIQRAHRRLVQKYHPDHNGGDVTAEAKFKVVQEAYDVLSDPEKRRQYDRLGEVKDARPIPVRHKSRTYLVGQPIGGSDIADLYRCTYEDGKPKVGVFKIVRHPRDNDLAANEIEVLKALHKDAPLQTVFFPDVVDAFPVTDGKGRRHVTVFPKTEGFFSLEEIYRAYPNGVDARDMAWMFNRIMEALYFAHRAGYVHGAVLPSNILLQTDDHSLILSEWSFAVDITKKGGYVKAMSNWYRDWYPPEVVLKLTPMPATDIYMAAKCVVKLLGGDPITGVMPNTVPRRINWFLRACLVGAPSRRPNDVGVLREEFGGLLRELYGKRQFRPFTMPHTVGV